MAGPEPYPDSAWVERQPTPAEVIAGLELSHRMAEAERPDHPDRYAYGAVLGSLAAWRVQPGMVPAVDITVNTPAGPVVVTIDTNSLRRMIDRAEEI
jgi:hypothetical protein